MTQYSKAPTTILQQIERLKSKGLIINDEQHAIEVLKHTAYYRLRAYWVIFEEANRKFKPNTAFEDVINLYEFDRKIRQLILQNIEIVEISLRCRFSDLSIIYNSPHFYLDSSLFKNINLYNKSMQKLEDSLIKSNDELFIAHYKRKYTNPILPPIWSVVEILSIGELYHWLKNLQDSQLDNIAKLYEFPARQLFLSFLERINIVRNICAHHNRLWNRVIIKKQLMQMKKPLDLASSFNSTLDSTSSFFGTFTYLFHVIKSISITSANGFLHKFKNVVQEHHIKLTTMGFADNWDDKPLFKIK